MDTERPYDLVLFGATGFTGRLTAEYLARAVPDGCRWALAGRNRSKLEAVRRGLAVISPACADLPILAADATDPATLRTVAASARVVVSTVGPYLRYGEPLVAACADQGTDYLDLTGEPEFVDRMYLLHHARAVETGARLVHACGFDSVPHDLGVLFTVDALTRSGGVDAPGRSGTVDALTRDAVGDAPITVQGFVRAGGVISGGTLASFLAAASRPLGTLRAARARHGAEPRPAGRRIRAGGGRPGWSRAAHAWVLPLPTIDPQVVGRSAAALPGYGPDFRYGHHAAVKRLPIALAGTTAVVLLTLAAQLPPLRRALSGLYGPGDGPGPERRARSWFTVRFVGEHEDRRLITEVSGGDPGYDETAKMLAESALCLAFDELPPTAGQVTTATAMGRALIARLTAAGLRFAVLDAPPTHAPGR